MVDEIITNLGVFKVVEGGLKVIEMAAGVEMDDIRQVTEATLVT